MPRSWPGVLEVRLSALRGLRGEILQIVDMPN
jgi:hypothetical protein